MCGRSFVLQQTPWYCESVRSSAHREDLILKFIGGALCCGHATAPHMKCQRVTTTTTTSAVQFRLFSCRKGAQVVPDMYMQQIRDTVHQ
jgi:hypothetical protein